MNFPHCGKSHYKEQNNISLYKASKLKNRNKNYRGILITKTTEQEQELQSNID